MTTGWGPFPTPDGTVAVVNELPCSYRQLDYWCRMGWVWCSRPSAGSGSRRQFTSAERAAIADVAAEVKRLEAARARLRSGEFFAERLAVHERGQVLG